jgi:hypothetical protein
MKTAAHLSSRTPILNRKALDSIGIKDANNRGNSALHDREICLENVYQLRI